MAAADDPASKLTPAQRKRLRESRPYIAVAPKVVKVATDVPLPAVDHRPAGANRPTPSALEALAGRWGLGGALQRLLLTLRR